jgi:hypothetical protein
MRIQTFSLGMLLVALALFTHTILADDAAARRQIIDLLETGWNTSETAQLLADEKYAAIRKAAGADPQAMYARALVLMYQRRYEESLKALDQVVAVEENHLAALRAKTWLALLLKNYGVALASAENLGNAIQHSTTEPKNKEASDDAARFLGSVFGFLEGPIGDIPATATRKAVEKKVLDALTDEQTAIFKDARQSVIEKFTELTTERADSREQAIADAEAEKQETLKDIDKRRDEMATQADELRERRSQVQGELRDELDEVAKADRPLQRELTGIQSRAVGVQSNADLVAVDIARLQSLIVRERDPVIRDDLGREIDRLSILINRYETDLALLNRQAAGVQARRAELAARQARAERDLGGQIQSIDRQLNSMQGEERRLAGAEKKARKPSTGYTGKVNALATTATALKTYEPFPIEQERERLMEELR